MPARLARTKTDILKKSIGEGTLQLSHFQKGYFARFSSDVQNTYVRRFLSSAPANLFLWMSWIVWQALSRSRTVVPHLNCRPAPVSKGLDPEGARCQTGRTLHHVGPCSIAVDS